LFRDFAYLKSGNEKQRRVHAALEALDIVNRLSPYTPVLCGTIPIAIDVAGSDLDLIMEVHDFGAFSQQVISLYGNCEGFRIKETILQGIPTIKANFYFDGFPFELFGQPQPVGVQNAYRHMLVEHYLLTETPLMRSRIIQFKEQGLKTEPAFAQLLGLAGDPYDGLLDLGRSLGIYSM